MKTVMVLILCLGAPLAQEGLDKKVAEIVARLADDAIDAREQAVKDLAGLGPAAIPVLRKAMARLDGEVRGRIDEAIKAIEAQDTLARSLPPLRTVTLDHRNRPAKEALEEIGRQTGITVQFEGDVGKEPLSITLKGATPLEAFDEVCRKHGQLLPQIQAGEEGLVPLPHAGAGPGARIVFLAAPFVAFPTSYVRHYRTRVTEVSLTRVNNFQGTQSTGNLQMEVQWPPNVSPRQCVKFEITALADDKGRSLLAEKKEEDG
ncbi:MAG TPA: hypothetical protein VEN81_16740, partial [Planctomycetota bacterium]|nr:hypothetical protein [Planctomycetota bacterium]